MKTSKIIIILFAILWHSITQAQNILWSKKANTQNLQINSLAFNHDGTQVLSGTDCHPAYIRIFNSQNGNLKWNYKVGNSYLCIMGVSFGSNSKYIASIEEFGNILIFDNSGSSPILIDSFKTGTLYGFNLAFSEKGDRLAVGCSNGKLKVYDLVSKTLVIDINAHTSWVTAVTFSSDGQYLITGGNDDKVKIWNNTGDLVRTLSGHTGDISSVKILSDNSHILSSSKDKTAKLWKFSDGAIVRTFTGHRREINDMDLSGDETKIATVSSDSTCRIWNLNSGQELLSFGVKDSGSLRAVAWSPVNNQIATGSVLSDIVLWKLPTSLSVKQVEKTDNEITLFPNPSSGFLTWTESSEKPLTIVIFDHEGREIMQLDSEDTSADVHELNNGFYMLQINHQNGAIIRKRFILSHQ